MPTLPAVPAALAAALDRLRARPRRHLRATAASRSSRTARACARRARLGDRRIAAQHPRPRRARSTTRTSSPAASKRRRLAGVAARACRCCCRAQEFERSLDAFPVEYGDIIAHHVVVTGDDPFAGLSVRRRRPAPRVRALGQVAPDPPARGLHRGRRRCARPWPDSSSRRRRRSRRCWRTSRACAGMRRLGARRPRARHRGHRGPAGGAVRDVLALEAARHARRRHRHGAVPGLSRRGRTPGRTSSTAGPSR